MPMLLSVDNLVASVSPPTILTVLFSFTAAEPVSPVYTMPSSRVATVAPPTVIRSIDLPLTSLAAGPAAIVAVEPSAPVKVIEPSTPPVPSLPLALPKVRLSASFTS